MPAWLGRELTGEAARPWHRARPPSGLQYVDAHGQVTRTEAAELCSVTPDRASRLMRRLAKEGKLKLRGERRGSEYVRPAR